MVAPAAHRPLSSRECRGGGRRSPRGKAASIISTESVAAGGPTGRRSSPGSACDGGEAADVRCGRRSPRRRSPRSGFSPNATASATPPIVTPSRICARAFQRLGGATGGGLGGRDGVHSEVHDDTRAADAGTDRSDSVTSRSSLSFAGCKPLTARGGVVSHGSPGRASVPFPVARSDRGGRGHRRARRLDTEPRVSHERRAVLLLPVLELAGARSPARDRGASSSRRFDGSSRGSLSSARLGANAGAARRVLTSAGTGPRRGAMTADLETRSFDEALFVVCFARCYGPAITARAAAARRGALAEQLSPERLLRLAERRVESSDRGSRRPGSIVRGAMQRQARALRRAGVEERSIATALDGQGAYQLQHVRGFAEVMRGLPSDLLRFEVEDGARDAQRDALCADGRIGTEPSQRILRGPPRTTARQRVSARRRGGRFAGYFACDSTLPRRLEGRAAIGATRAIDPRVDAWTGIGRFGLRGRYPSITFNSHFIRVRGRRRAPRRALESFLRTTSCMTDRSTPHSHSPSPSASAVPRGLEILALLIVLAGCSAGSSDEAESSASAVSASCPADDRALGDRHELQVGQLVTFKGGVFSCRNQAPHRGGRLVSRRRPRALAPGDTCSSGEPLRRRRSPPRRLPRRLRRPPLRLRRRPRRQGGMAPRAWAARSSIPRGRRRTSVTVTGGQFIPGGNASTPRIALRALRVPLWHLLGAWRAVPGGGKAGVPASAEWTPPTESWEASRREGSGVDVESRG